MQLPVYANGGRVGAVEIVPQGRFYRARVQMENIGRVARLTLYGTGGSVYLGIPEPDGAGGMILSRTLRAVPEGLQYAAEQPQISETKPGEPKRNEPEREDKSAPAPRHVVWMGGRPYYF